MQRLEPRAETWLVLEERERLVHGHVQCIGNARALVADLQRLSVVSPAVADLAGHIHIRQELHLDPYDSCPLAGLATPTAHVKGKASGPVTSHFGFRQCGIQLAQRPEYPGVGRRIGPRRAPDGRLINVDHLVQVF